MSLGGDKQIVDNDDNDVPMGNFHDVNVENLNERCVKLLLSVTSVRHRFVHGAFKRVRGH